MAQRAASVGVGELLNRDTRPSGRSTGPAVVILQQHRLVPAPSRCSTCAARLDLAPWCWSMASGPRQVNATNTFDRLRPDPLSLIERTEVAHHNGGASRLQARTPWLGVVRLVVKNRFEGFTCDIPLRICALNAATAVSPVLSSSPAGPASAGGKGHFIIGGEDNEKQQGVKGMVRARPGAGSAARRAQPARHRPKPPDAGQILISNNVELGRSRRSMTMFSVSGALAVHNVSAEPAARLQLRFSRSGGATEMVKPPTGRGTTEYHAPGPGPLCERGTGRWRRADHPCWTPP